MRAKFYSFILFIIVTSAFAQQKVEWKGTIENEDEVRIIKNPEEPLYGELVFFPLLALKMVMHIDLRTTKKLDT